MKTSSGILAILASSTVLALPHGDKKRALPTEEETQYLKQAIELLSSYEYEGTPYPPIKPLKGTGGIKGPIKLPDWPVPYPPKFDPELSYVQNNKRSPLKKEEQDQLRQAIELLSSYEYGGHPGTGPYFPQGPDINLAQKTKKRAPVNLEEELELKQAIELLSYYEYGQPPHPPIGPIKPVKPKYPTKPGPYLPVLEEVSEYVPKTKRSPLKIEEQYEIQQAIEILSQYEYGQPQPPVLPVRPVRPTPYNPKYAIPRSIDDADATESIRAAIELLTKYEYGPRPYKLNPNEVIPRTIPDADKDSLIAAIELLNKYEYNYPPKPWVKPQPIYTLDPVPTLKPAPVPKYEPSPIINKRIIKELVDEYSQGWSEADYHLAIGELSQKEYLGKPIKEVYEPYIPPPPAPAYNPPVQTYKPVPVPTYAPPLPPPTYYNPPAVPTYKPIPLPTVRPKPLPPYINPGPQYPKREDHPDLNEEEFLKLAIDTLSRIEYGPGNGPVRPGYGYPVKGPVKGYPVPLPGPILTHDVEKEGMDIKVD